MNKEFEEKIYHNFNWVKWAKLCVPKWAFLNDYLPKKS